MTATFTEASAGVGSWLTRLRRQVPSGRSLSAAAWGSRHGVILTLLWLHAIGLTAYALASRVGTGVILLQGGAIFAFAGLASWERMARRGRVVFASLGLLVASGFLIQLSSGATLAHFHMFLVVGVLALYEDWLPFALAVAFIALHHGIVGSMTPAAVFDSRAAMIRPWRWAFFHAAFVATLAIVLSVTGRIMERARSDAKDLVAGTTEGILALDHKRRITFANRAALKASGYTEADILRLPIASLLRARPDKTGPRTEGLLRRADGREVAVEWTDAPLEGASSARVITFRETARRREAERQLEAARLQLARSEKLTAVGQLVAGVAHEIRTPLTYLETNLHLIKRRLDRLAPAERAQVDEHMHHAIEAADRINRLVDDLRRYSKLKPGTRDMVALHEVVQEAVNLFAATHRAHVRVRTALLATPPAPIDRVQAQQIVLNLMQNAAEAMPQGGTITVQTMMLGGNCVLVVEDEGRGIPADIRDRVYDPFFTTKSDGTGLGLSVVKRLVDEHRGTIRCDERYGGGTRFEVSLPAKAPPSREVPVNATAEARPTAPERAR